MLQQIPGAKVIYIDIGITTEYVLCHSPNMGYYIAATVKPEDVVICTTHQATRIANMLQQMPNVLMINGFGQEVHRTMHGVKWMICDLKFGAQCSPEQPEQPEQPDCFQFVNYDGNLLRFSETKGYYIDPTAPHHHIVQVVTESAATEFLKKMQSLVERDGEFTDVHGRAVNSKLALQGVV